MKKNYALLAVSLFCAALSLNAQNKPFPQAITYPNCIKPNNVTQATLNANVGTYYDYWKANYVKTLSTLPGGYYIKGDISGDAEGFMPLGSSEGHGYGMVITALMAGYDPNAQTVFDGLFKTARAYHSSINKNLMGWVVANDVKAQGHFDSATDGDMDIAYALILAHYQWGSNGAINYLNEAKNMINNGLKVSYVTNNNRLNLGDWDSKSALNSRPSDWMFDHMRAFYQETNDATWLNVINNLYSVYNQFSTSYSPSTGLISDFIVNDPPQPAPKNYIDEGPQTNEYNYNACRVPLRLVMDYAMYGSSSALALSNKMVNWIVQKTGGNPASIRDGYQLNGTADGTDPEAVFVAPFVAASVANPNNQAFLNSGWTFLKTAKSGYYSDTYSLLCQLFISGNWWIPGSGVTTPVCTPVSASSDDGDVPANVLDNNFDTRWSAAGDGQWIQFCLGTPTPVNGVDIAFYQGNTRQAFFDIQTSNDGSTWANAATGLHSSGTSTALETFSFPQQTVQYVRILGHQNSVSEWNSYTEVHIRTAQNSQQSTLTAVKDAYVRNGDFANDTYGAEDPTLLATKLNSASTPGYDRQTYLGFDLSNVSGNITSVQLKLYGHIEDTRVSNIPVSVFSVSNTTWAENTLTWNNKPATGSSLSTATVLDSTSRYYTWDVTAYVQGEKAAGRNQISLALISGLIADPRITWHSKETGSNPPQLVVTTFAATAKTLASAVSEEPASAKLTSTVNVYPNPFREEITVAFSLREAGPTSVVLYDISGKQTSVLLNETLGAGQYQRSFTPGNIPTGMYVLKLVHNGKMITYKLLKQ
jgi:endo-1,4-beta-D-glucanase Y